MNNGTMNSVPLPALTSGEHDCLMTEVQIRPTVTSPKKHKHPINWLKAHLCQNKLTFGLCLSLLLAIAIVISLLFLYILHKRIRPERKQKQNLLFFNISLYFSLLKHNYVLHLNVSR
jgi:hypothetical protein